MTAEEQDAAKEIVHKFFDDLTSESVHQYIEERDREARLYGEQLAAANRSLQAINARLQQVDESRLRLTRTISHELRNFLNGVNMAAQILQRTEDEEIRQKVLANLNGHVGDMKELLNQLLDYAVLLAGRAQLRLESFDLPTLFDELVTTFRPQIEAVGLAFSATLDPSL